LANMLQTMLLRAEVAVATEPLSNECSERMEKIVVDGQRGANMIRGLLEHARHKIAAMPPVELRVPVKAALECVKAGGTLKVDYSEGTAPLQVVADPVQIIDLIVLILTEGARENDSGTRHAIELRSTAEVSDAPTWTESEDWAMIRYTRVGAGAEVELDATIDSAPGEVVETGEHDFNLLRARGIVREHRGQLRVTEQMGDGDYTLVAEVFLPLSD